ncbi:uncharacterized protein B0I36DRAFT_325260 [Microdochium trichocladiopsis]|uniref:Uncharacterized protein n=1 Tax=Microdochium trichocladiopsis TaxID=1682393 RepID=A0A9P8Y542_9PEZI|nr:uncharacterized protein B0I36DRAFT_325260 [Microdochium trichocladiopsis]KAH7029205.1 hypothetical protein B0I36DRAFT_325260 [Microdochium trichocladiopsis]
MLSDPISGGSCWSPWKGTLDESGGWRPPRTKTEGGEDDRPGQARALLREQSPLLLETLSSHIVFVSGRAWGWPEGTTRPEPGMHGCVLERMRRGRWLWRSHCVPCRIFGVGTWLSGSAHNCRTGGYREWTGTGRRPGDEYLAYVRSWCVHM